MGERVQRRDRATGRYGFHGDWDRMCVCGRTLGEHTAEPPHECFAGDYCERFRPSRRRRGAQAVDASRRQEGDGSPRCRGCQHVRTVTHEGGPTYATCEHYGPHGSSVTEHHETGGAPAWCPLRRALPTDTPAGGEG